MLQKALFEALDFKIFRTPLEHTRGGEYKFLKKIDAPPRLSIPGSATVKSR